MHREFIKLLANATGVSEHIIAINLDIRGFTSFCQSVESLDVATYVKKVYLKIINNYFKNAKYYKPAGDGLVIILPYNEEDLEDILSSTVNSCLDLLGKFGSLCIDEPMINYPTPQKIGIGITRGSACCITSEEKILDYSGRILNLASRLMELARPGGIVLDDSFGMDLLPDETKELFSEENVYVRGIAESDPIRIHYTRGYTLISDIHKQPIKEPEWLTDSEEHQLRDLLKLKGAIALKVSRKPLNVDTLMVRVVFDNPMVAGFRRYIEYTVASKEVEYKRVGSKSQVLLDLIAVRKELLEEEQVPHDAVITFETTYPVSPR